MGRDKRRIIRLERGLERIQAPGAPDRYRVKLMVAGRRVSKTFPTLADAAAARDRYLAGGELPTAGKGLPSGAELERQAEQTGTETVEDGLWTYQDKLEGQGQDFYRVRQLIPMLRRLAPEILDKPVLTPDTGDDRPRRSNVLEADFWTIRHRREAEGKTAQTIRSDLGRLRSMLRLYDKGFTVEDKVFPQMPAPRIRELTEVQRAAIFERLLPPFHEMTILASLTAMRKGEILTMLISDVVLDSKPRVELRRAKEGAGRRVWLGPTAARILRTWLTRPGRPDSLFVFPNPQGAPYSGVHVTREFRTACDRAGVPDFHFHDLRHHAAMIAAANGASDRELMQIGGWRSVATIKKYVEARPENVRRLVALVEEAPTGVRHALRTTAGGRRTARTP